MSTGVLEKQDSSEWFFDDIEDAFVEDQAPANSANPNWGTPIYDQDEQFLIDAASELTHGSYATYPDSADTKAERAELINLLQPLQAESQARRSQ